MRNYEPIYRRRELRLRNTTSTRRVRTHQALHHRTPILVHLCRIAITRQLSMSRSQYPIARHVKVPSTAASTLVYSIRFRPLDIKRTTVTLVSSFSAHSPTVHEALLRIPAHLQLVQVWSCNDRRLVMAPNGHVSRSKLSLSLVLTQPPEPLRG